MRHGMLAIASLSLIALVGCSPQRSPDEKSPPTTAEKKETPPAGQPPVTEKKEPATSPPAAAPKAEPAPPSGPHPALLDPSRANEKAPETFQAKFTTTKGDFTVAVTRAWSPNGADRFYNLVKIGYFTDVAFFRAIEGFMVQFGIHGDSKVNEKWRSANIPDDPVVQSNRRGYITFAKTGLPNSRSTQLFINFKDNSNLDDMGFSAIGQVSQGMEVVDSLFKGYGEGAPRGAGPDQGLIQSQGNEYLKKSFPNLDYIKSAAIVP